MTQTESQPAMSENTPTVVWQAPPVRKRRGRRGIDISAFVGALRANPGQWGAFPIPVSSLTTAMRKEEGIEWQLVASDAPNRYIVHGRTVVDSAVSVDDGTQA